MMDEYPVCAYCAGPLRGGSVICHGVQVHRICAAAAQGDQAWIDLVVEAAMSELDAELAFLLG